MTTETQSDEISRKLQEIRHLIDALEQPSTFIALSVKELRQLAVCKADAFTQANRLETMLSKTFLK